MSFNCGTKDGWLNMNYLLTGGAGFIGSHVGEALLSLGHTIDVIDNFDPYYSKDIKEQNLSNIIAHANARFFELDIQNYADLVDKFGNCQYDAIIHLAAKAGVRPSIVDPIRYQNVNVGGTQNVLELARLIGVEHVVYGSSSSVYGINPDVPWSEANNVLLPISPYASSKVSGELLGHVYSQLFNIRFIALRFFTVYGPRQRPDLAIHKFAKRILDGQEIPVYGDGSTSRDYTYVDDIVAGILAAIDYSKSNYEIINLGNSNPLTLSNLILELEQIIGKKAIINRLPMQAGDVSITYSDISKAKALLDYHPTKNITEGLTTFINWLTTNQNV